ncbi:interleukin-1 receptor-associated kinase 1 [Stegastes partitus]|uniref:Interleukin-1 receptor-associated kinase 1 n=1 Tax=Stegastes partitus TaxID=144197 RepID=A0A9Y4KGT6_9TELE|nr:PREDICTED: interleukin-1 receptor-associated kinase 1 [Stegastes partitus]
MVYWIWNLSAHDLVFCLTASEVLGDQTAVRLAERMKGRTDWVMNQWGNRNGRVGELIDLLESLQLLRPRDVILDWLSSWNPPVCVCVLQDCVFLSWSQRINIVHGASAALQFLHFPPRGQTPLIHGDVKSSNILLDRHLVAKLSDFGLARFVSRSPSASLPAPTMSVGKTATVRGTLAYLPDEYVRNGQLGTAVDVYSFGVVLLEVLTGRRALHTDGRSGQRFLKDLVEELEDSSAAAWKKQLDERLTAGGAVEPASCLQVAALACKCLDKNKRKRPAMNKVFYILEEIQAFVGTTSSSSSSGAPSVPRPPPCLDSSVGALSQQLSTLGPLEDSYPSSQSSQSSQSSPSLCSLPPPHPLRSSSSLPPLSSLSFLGPCETDESRGFSQYDLSSQFNGTSSRDQNPHPHPSVPTEDRYNFPPQPSSTSDSAAGATAGTTAGFCGFSPAGSLQSMFPVHSVHMNPRKQRLLEKKAQYEEGRIQTPELLSSDDLYGQESSDFRGPEESDELEYLPAKHD